MKFKRIFVIVLDSLGVGAMPDAPDYGDADTDTLGHIVSHRPDLKIPNLRKLGIANLHTMSELPPANDTLGYSCYLNETSVGKDTMTGHWEMMGIHTQTPFKVFTETGFPEDLIHQLESYTGKQIVGNKSASGTEILDELALEEIQNGKLIVYTSADSVLQICGHEEVMGLDTLYRYCEYARNITLDEKWKVGRIIARPYIGWKVGEFKRTSNRHDYALSPPAPTVLDILKDNHYDVVSVGKIKDIFNNSGITESLHSSSSVQGMEQTIELQNKDFTGLCFTNLVDFDALWGHRRNVDGYANELESFDEKLGIFLANMREDDLVILTADHGNDPTHTGTDHTREKVFMLTHSPSFTASRVLPPQTSFGTIGATIAENFSLSMPPHCIGTSLYNQLN